MGIPESCSPWGHRVRHDWAIAQQQWQALPFFFWTSNTGQKNFFRVRRGFWRTSAQGSAQGLRPRPRSRWALPPPPTIEVTLLLPLAGHVESDSSWPHGLQPARLLCPWNSPGKITGVGCHSLFQGMLPTQGLNLGIPHRRRSLPSEPPGKASRDLDLLIGEIS